MVILILINGVFAITLKAQSNNSLYVKITKMHRNLNFKNASYDTWIGFEKEYDYKGQRWFGINKILTEQEIKKVNYEHTTQFYNQGCNLVATWRRTGGNGFVRANNILPDTIEKTKIIKVAEKVPENIMRLAINHNAVSISKYEYQGQTLYFLDVRNNRFHNPVKEKRIESYYEKNGKEIIYFKEGVNPPSFSRMDAEERNATAHPEKLIPKGIIWHNPYYRQMK